MGFWETLSTIKINSPDLITPINNVCKSSYDLGCNAVNFVKDKGVQTVYSTTDIIRRNSLDLLTPVRNVCKSSYDLGWSSVSAVSVNGVQKVKENIPSVETMEKLTEVVTHPATKEVLKFVFPGLPPRELVSMTL
ncbi:hypothetical protein GIB67_025126 [Kingdonia uniflora]|uniref:Uncharacterized protein n=1 Tax=Kingdonia uniflora TaxID=39325 RepID=A0A7J7N897_9MAGN|nr:hypothetical protein GIB67_025126 [Kingdonia uniflora]